MLLSPDNQMMINESAPKSSINTLSIIENRLFSRENSGDINQNNIPNNINPFKKESNNNNINFNNNNQLGANLQGRPNPFHNPDNNIDNNIRQNNNNINLNKLMNNQNINILNKKNYIYNIYGDLYSYLNENNQSNENNIIISDLEINNNINNNYRNMNPQLNIPNNHINFNNN